MIEPVYTLNLALKANTRNAHLGKCAKGYNALIENEKPSLPWAGILTRERLFRRRSPQGFGFRRQGYRLVILGR